MSTVQMNSNTGITGSVGLPNGNTVSLTNGIGAVTQGDVQTAINAGWKVQAGEVWPQVKHMTPPVGGAWPVNGTVTSPDGQSIAVTAGVALVPIVWINYFAAMGWTVTGRGE